MKKLIVIAGGKLVDPKNQRNGNFDLLIEDGLVKAIDKPGSFKAVDNTDVIDASGKVVVPGLIDLHVHLREPGFEWKETIKSGAEAAVMGGFTSICCMPNTKPVNDGAEITRFILEKARKANAARVLPIGAISIKSMGDQLAPYSELKAAGCVAFSDDGEPVMNAAVMRRALEWCLMLDVPICCHEEDKNISCGGCMNESALSTRLGLAGMPKLAEEIMIARDIEIARTTGGKVHICHVSSGRGVELIRRAKNDGINITCEVTPMHITLTEEAIGNYDTHFKFSPPLREEYEREALFAGLKDGTIDAVASDHAPHDPDTKDVEFAKASMGVLGLQTSLPVLLQHAQSGAITLEKAIESLTTKPAAAYRLNAGHLAPKMPADITLIDLDYKWRFDAKTNLSVSRNSPFWDKEFKGIADTVLVGGEVKVMNKRLMIHE